MSTISIPDQNPEIDPPVEISLLETPIIRLIFSTAYLFVFLSTVIGNVVILCVFVSQRRLRSLPKFFLVNLTIADFFVGCFCVLQNAAHFVMFDHRWPFGRFMCHTYIYLIHMLPNVSAGILVLVSVERFVAVLRPLRVRRAFPRSVLIASSAAVWLTSAIMNFPYFFTARLFEFTDFTNGQILSSCTRNLGLEIYGFNVVKTVTTINFIFWYAIPLITLLIIYATIFAVIRRAETCPQNNKLIPENTKAVLPQIPQEGQEEFRTRDWRSGSTVTVEKRRRVGRLAFGIVLSFALLSLPRYAYLIWTTFRDRNEPRCLGCWFNLAQPITFLLLFLNSAINPFLYAFLSARFRESIKDTFYCRREIDKRVFMRQITVKREVY
ncbi:unnamed protein product, partial [Mesorhabditis belari]|uniref:G-protein coupled receptors family 1 profile domain-containing protein n=1 Tax=Mesorhabditis belari TaxID=2138241 RepID=A0AAF3ELU9_9BILA